MDKVKFNLDGKIVEMEKAKVSSALETGEVTINTDSLTILEKSEDNIIYNKADFETFTSNTRKEGYDDGKKAGEEMPIKAARETLGLSFEGKTMDSFLPAYKDKILADAKLNPDKRVQELEGDLNKLQTSYGELETSFTTFKQETTQKETRAKEDNSLLALIPEDKLVVSKDIALLALKTKKGVGVTFSDNGQPLQTINGEIQKGNTREPIPLDQDFINNNLTELGLFKSKQGGPGGEDELGGKAGSYTAFKKEMLAEGIADGSEKFNLEMNKRIADKSLQL